MSFSDRLKNAIEGESARAFAHRVGISETAMRKYLTGESTPNLDRLIAIAEGSGRSVEWLATGEEAASHQDTVQEPMARYRRSKVSVTSSTIGKRLAEARKDLGLTQQQFSDQTDIPMDDLIGYEGDQKVPDGVALKAMIALGIDVNALLIGDDDGPDEQEELPSITSIVRMGNAFWAALGAIKDTDLQSAILMSYLSEDVALDVVASQFERPKQPRSSLREVFRELLAKTPKETSGGA